MQLDIDCGLGSQPIQVDQGRLVSLQTIDQPRFAGSIPARFADAIESPIDYPALRSCLTPDDRVAIVVDGDVVGIDDVLDALVEKLLSAGIRAAQIQIVTASGPQPSRHVSTRPSPDAQERMEFLGTTKAGQRVYLDRATLEADAIVVVSGVRLDAAGHASGGESWLFRCLCDRTTQRRLIDDDDEAAELGWLLGAPFYIHVAEGDPRSPTEYFVGTAKTFEPARRRVEEVWSCNVDRRADLVIAAVSSPRQTQSWSHVIQAAAHAAAVAAEDGRICVLSSAKLAFQGPIRRAMEVDSPAAALSLLKGDESDDTVLARTWFRLAKRYKLCLLADASPEDIEAVFATPLQNFGQVQRLIDAAEAVLVIPDADRRAVRVPSAKDKRR